MTTFSRQYEVLKVTEEEALEGFMRFLGIRTSKAEKYPDYVAERLSAVTTLEQLAIMEKAFGTEKVRAWLVGSAAKARAQLEGDAA